MMPPQLTLLGPMRLPSATGAVNNAPLSIEDFERFFQAGLDGDYIFLDLEASKCAAIVGYCCHYVHERPEQAGAIRSI